MARRISPNVAVAAAGRAENIRSVPGFTCTSLARRPSLINRLTRLRTVALPTFLLTEKPALTASPGRR